MQGLFLWSLILSVMGWQEHSTGGHEGRSYGSIPTFTDNMLEEEVPRNAVLGRFGGNPLSLVMGWKETFTKPWRFSKRRKTVAIRFRWIWVGKWNLSQTKIQDHERVAIRFRWIWVGKSFFQQ